MANKGGAGLRDHAEYVLVSGQARFVVTGTSGCAAVHHAKHGDGINDLALEVPDVDKAYAYALSKGGREEEPRLTDEHGTVRRHRHLR